MGKRALIEIENIKNEKLICLDFDDCIIPWSKPIFNEQGRLLLLENTKEERLKELEKNVGIIKEFCKKNNCKVFIISSWSPIIKNDLTLIEACDDLNDYWKIIKQLPIIGKDPFKNREITMDVLIENGNQIICIDDFDLEPHFEYAGTQFQMLNVFMGLGLTRLLNMRFHSKNEI
jgi:hypothetical protein